MEARSTASTRFCHVLITGPPGIGKTTVCKKVLALIARNGLSCDGFFTEEIRSSSNRRIGFDVVPVKWPENRSPLARVTNLTNPQELMKEYRVGKYAVFVKNFERVALPVFETDSNVLLLDEIGKMELFSKSFIEKLKQLVYGAEEQKSRCILATIPEVAPAAHLSLIQKLRNDQRCKIYQVSYENRDHLPEEIYKIILHILKHK